MSVKFVKGLASAAGSIYYIYINYNNNIQLLVYMLLFCFQYTFDEKKIIHICIKYL